MTSLDVRAPDRGAPLDRFRRTLPSQKIFGGHVTQADRSRHVFREWPMTRETIMTPNTFAAAPALMKSRHWSADILKSGLVDSLTELVKIPASQSNGCAFWLHMHSAGARKHGESEERTYPLDAWRESPLDGERERAALAWTGALTLVSGTRPPDNVYRPVKAHFTEQGQVTLSLPIGVINGWDRIQVGVRAVHPARQREAA
jgi:AhpD family alkylhydroperoxidase